MENRPLHDQECKRFTEAGASTVLQCHNTCPALRLQLHHHSKSCPSAACLALSSMPRSTSPAISTGRPVAVSSVRNSLMAMAAFGSARETSLDMVQRDC